MSLINAHQHTAALVAGIELDIFTALAAGAQTTQALVAKTQASERGLRILCDYLVIIGLLEKTEDRYSLTPDSAAFLDQRSPSYLGGVVNWTKHSGMRGGIWNLADAVRQGGTVLPESGSIKPNNPLWVNFARNMMGMMKPAAHAIASLLNAQHNEPWKVLDIAASHGLYGITIAQQNPQAQIFALDWPDVLAVTQENAQAAGVWERYHLLPGSAFEVDYGKDYDVVLITNFFHMFDLPTCEQILQKSYQVLNPGGKVVILELIPNPDRVTPPEVAEFSLKMLMNTPSGDAYTFREYEEILRRAGFEKNELHAITSTPQSIILSTKSV